MMRMHHVPNSPFLCRLRVLAGTAAAAITKAITAAGATAAATASLADGEWWEAELEVPFEAAAINFVVNFYEHYDNNGSKVCCLMLCYMFRCMGHMSGRMGRLLAHLLSF